MAKASKRPLKVFQAQFGFFDTVVAAPSQAAARLVWGTHQNLFANGQARITTDDAAVAAALKQPGVLLRRAVGSTDPFQQGPARLPEAPGPSPETSPKKRERAKPEPSRPPPDRSGLTAAESALKELDERREAEEVAFRRQLDALDAQRAAAHDTYTEARRKMKAALAAARTSYRAAGGED